MESRPRSRRSNIDLKNLSIAPLSKAPTYPSSYDDAHEASSPYHRSSYIQDRSTPTTPGILSRSSSFSKQHRTASSRSYTHLAFANTEDAASAAAEQLQNAINSRTLRGRVPSSDSSSLPKSKSTTVLYRPGMENMTTMTPTRNEFRKSTRSGGSHKKSKSNTYADDSLLLRLGSAIATSNREQKGQSWLASRTSTTSLTGMDDRTHDDIVERARAEFREYVPELSFGGSRLSSRAASRSRLDMAGYTPFGAGSRTPRGARTPRGPRTPGIEPLSYHATAGEDGRERGDYFGTSAGFDGLVMRSGIASKGPDFVDPRDQRELEAAEIATALHRHDTIREETSSEDEDGDDDEVARLAQTQSFGFGGFIDRLVGWSFERELGEDEDETFEAKKLQAQRRRKSRTADDVPRGLAQEKKEESKADEAVDKDGSGWGDAAWLMSVASKALFA